jgi:hypothetical protein
VEVVARSAIAIAGRAANAPTPSASSGGNTRTATRRPRFEPVTALSPFSATRAEHRNVVRI